MSLPRFLVTAVIVSASVAPLSAQSGSAGVQLSPVVPQSGLMGRDVSRISVALPAVLRVVDGGKDSGRCFAIRSSQFAAESGDSDVVKRLGHSTCQPSSKVKLKNLEMPSVR